MIALLIATLLGTVPQTDDQAPTTSSDRLQTGLWRASLDCPGGEIPFQLEIGRLGVGWSAVIRNAEERIQVERVEVGEGTVTLHIAPYDSRLKARVLDGGKRLEGEWERYRGPGQWTRMPFAARAGIDFRFAPDTTPVEGFAEVSGRWSVQFESDKDPAVGVFRTQGTRATGTFMTTLGDYRYLEGHYDQGKLLLSVFDGAHAFLFRARLEDDGTLTGDFWSRDTWHETWTARRDDTAALPDPFGLTKWTGAVPLDQLVFPDITGKPRNLAEEALAGKARMIVLFGTWCPNCHDETNYLVELYERFHDKGLAITGLAFEFGDDQERNLGQIRHYADHHGIQYPVLLAGEADKKKASEAFPALDKVKAYPTTIFMDGSGKVRAVHTGFAGPATGIEHDKLRLRFEGLIENLLRE